MATLRSTLVAVVVVALTLAGCRRNEKACRERCAALGVEATSEQCTELCTKSCKELHETFGVDEAHCRQLQEGP